MDEKAEMRNKIIHFVSLFNLLPENERKEFMQSLLEILDSDNFDEEEKFYQDRLKSGLSVMTFEDILDAFKEGDDFNSKNLN